MKLKKIFLVPILICVLLLSSSATLVAAQANSSIEDSANNVENILYDEVAAESCNKLDKIPALWVDSEQKNMQKFLSDPSAKKDFCGLYNIKSAKITEIKEVPVEKINQVVNIERYIQSYGDVKVYYLGIDYNVHKENKYYYNGVNYRLAILVPESGIWKIASLQDTSALDMVSLNLGFESTSESIACNIDKARAKGKFINKSGDLLEDVSKPSSKFEADQQNNITTMSTTTEPTYIRVYCTNQTNFDYYGIYHPGTVWVTFDYYVPNVLPNEWINSWSTTAEKQALQAGAQAVKMYGWYHVYYPKWGIYDADVQDNTNDQVFLVNSSIGCTNTNNAVSAMDGRAMYNTSTGSIFEPQYRAGSYNADGKNGGIVYQWGTKYLADNYGYTYDEILKYYYNTSSRTIGYFYY